MEQEDEWCFWDDVGLTCAGYSSDTDADLIRVFIETSKEVHWYTDIAERLILDVNYVKLLIEILCSADFCNYGTSPRGAWAEHSTYAENLDRLKKWYKRRWDEEFIIDGEQNA